MREHLLWSRECCLSESSQYSLEVFFIALNKFWYVQYREDVCQRGLP